MRGGQVPVLCGGSGSWTYKATGSGTLWTVHNTLVLRSGLLPRLLRPAFNWRLLRTTKSSLRLAKRIIENERMPRCRITIHCRADGPELKR